MSKNIIYKQMDVLCITTEENYHTRIRDARKIQKMDGFNTPEEVIEYYNRWFGTTDDDFIIIKEESKC